ncbi:hypothetical protein HispidOSU_013225 [Sigmodon hispidus]
MEQAPTFPTRCTVPRPSTTCLRFPPRKPLQVAAPLRSTTLAAYREAELLGAVQVPAPGAVAPRACTAQAAVGARQPARVQRRVRRGKAGHAGLTRGLPSSSHPAAPTWAAAGFRRSTAIAVQFRGAATRGRRKAADGLLF